MRLNTLKVTKTTFSTFERYEKHPRPFYMGGPPWYIRQNGTTQSTVCVKTFSLFLVLHLEEWLFSVETKDIVIVCTQATESRDQKRTSRDHLIFSWKYILFSGCDVRIEKNCDHLSKMIPEAEAEAVFSSRGHSQFSQYGATLRRSITSERLILKKRTE